MNVIMEQGEPFWLDFGHQSGKRVRLRNSKAGLKIKCTSKYLTKVNPKFPLDGSTQIKIPMTKKPVKPDLLQEAFRIEMLAI